MWNDSILDCMMNTDEMWIVYEDGSAILLLDLPIWDS